MPYFNRIEVIGKWSTEPELKFTAKDHEISDQHIVAFRKTKKGWQDCLRIKTRAYGKLAAIVLKYTQKDDWVHLSGELRFKSFWVPGEYGAKGRKTYFYFIQIRMIQFLGIPKYYQVGNHYFLTKAEYTRIQAMIDQNRQGAHGDGLDLAVLEEYDPSYTDDRDFDDKKNEEIPE